MPKVTFIHKDGSRQTVEFEQGKLQLDTPVSEYIPDFAMQDADWRPEDYRSVINTGLADMINSGSTTSWSPTR